MFAIFYSLEWKKSEANFIEQKATQRKPSGYAKEIRRYEDKVVYMIPEKNQYILTVQAENGQLYSEDVYGIIKYYKRNVRITKNFRIKFEDFMRTQDYSIDNHGCIQKLYLSIETFLKTIL